MTTTTVITPDSFPTPHLALRTDDPAELDRVRAFARRQAEFAETLRTRLASRWTGQHSHAGRVAVLRALHAETVAWRHDLALRAPRRIGQGLPLDAERFVTTLAAGGPNFDRIGPIGRLRAGSSWDATTRTYVGGASTPAYEVMAHYGREALARFDREGAGGTLQNLVAVSGYGRPVTGNRIVRGQAAREVADTLLARAASRGRDTSRMEVGGDLMYVVTAHPDDAEWLFGAALSLLADAHDPDWQGRMHAWQEARYLLYQAPQYKKGSDAVTRVFLVAVGAVLFGRAPILEHDVDLRCMVLGQEAATVMPADDSLID